MAESTTLTIPDIEIFKRKALYWGNHFKVACLLDSNNYPHNKYPAQNWTLAVDAFDEIRSGKSSAAENAFEKLKSFYSKVNAGIFGFFSYDLKNQLEKLSSDNYDRIKFPEIYFFKPRYIFRIVGDQLTLNRNYPETYEIISAITNAKIPAALDEQNRIKLHARTSKETYLENVRAIKMQIEDGDFYELNYCNEFYAENTEINPADIFLKMNEVAKAPFSCFFKLEDKFLLCASPERFLKKEGTKLIAQPVKGTIRKGNSQAENKMLQLQLRDDIKEQAENVMIVDLMRNDLSKSSKAGSVKVEELFGIYEFNTINQMISTVTSEINTEIALNRGASLEAIKNAFPMGSMTGAPKVIVMENIEKYEETKRGLFSGSVGYIAPEGNLPGAVDGFDFNVVIRSILYNAAEKYISIQVGGAITADSVPEKEYEEILLKARTITQALDAEITDRSGMD